MGDAFRPRLLELYDGGAGSVDDDPSVISGRTLNESQTNESQPTDLELALSDLDFSDVTAFDADAMETRPVRAIEEALTPLPEIRGVEPKGKETKLDRALPPNEVDKLLGTELHGFVLERHLKSGTHAHVFEAHHKFMNKRCAAKVLRPSFGGLGHCEIRMTREAELLAELRHPHIVTVDDFGFTMDGLPFMLMELVEGTGLDELIDATAPMRPRDILLIGAQIARGLGAAHDRGVVHRDLKPANIMIGADPAQDVKILDFGLARVATGGHTSITRIDQILGTPSYMAPEQITSPNDVGPAADLYALGAILYKMLLGRPPFVGDFETVMRGHVEEPPPPLPESSLARLVMQLLDKRPEHRPRSAHQVADAFEQLLSHASGSTVRRDPAETHPLPHDTAKQPSLTRRWVPALLVAVAAGAALLTWFSQSS